MRERTTCLPPGRDLTGGDLEAAQGPRRYQAAIAAQAAGGRLPAVRLPDAARHAAGRGPGSEPEANVSHLSRRRGASCTSSSRVSLRRTHSSKASTVSSASTVSISTGSPASTTHEPSSTPGESTTTMSGRTDHWAENRPRCSLKMLPDMLNLPHPMWLTCWGTVRASSTDRALCDSVCLGSRALARYRVLGAVFLEIGYPLRFVESGA